MRDLQGKRVAILATNGFEEAELFEPKKALEKHGAEVFIISPDKGRIKGWNHGNWSREIEVDLTVGEAKKEDFVALILPGGVINPDMLRRSREAINFVRGFFDNSKIVATICHGPQLLIEAGVVAGRTMTSFYSIKKDLQNAGANWKDAEVVVDGGLITSRNPGDLEIFNQKVIEEINKQKN